MSRVIPPGTVPGPTGPALWRAIWGLSRDPLGMYWRARDRYGDIIRFQDTGGAPWIFVAHPDMVARVHQGNHRNYGRGSLSDPFSLFLGDGLLTSERDTWTVRRRLMAPQFRADHRSASTQAIVDETERMLQEWDPRAGGPAFDVCPDLERLTFRIVLQGLFGIELGAEEDPALRWLTDALVYVSGESFRMYPVPGIVAGRARARFDARIQALDAVVSRAVRHRIAAGHDRGDLLDTLITADLGPRAVRNELLTMLHAGQHTVASSIAFTLHLLATHPAQAQRIADQISPATIPDPMRVLADLPDLTLTVHEAMRLYPAAWGGVRESIGEDELGGHRIEAGTPIVFSQYVTHRHPDFWPEPDRFIPERFAEGSTRQRHRYAYFPFGGGPHLCIGQDLAMIEVATVVAMILARFRFQPAPGSNVRPRALLDLVPAHGVPLTFTARAVAKAGPPRVRPS